MSEHCETRTNQRIPAVRTVLALACAMLLLAGMLHDAQHAASDPIESCAACLQLGHAAPTDAATLELLVRFETRVTPLRDYIVSTRTLAGTRLSRGPPLS